MNQYEKQPHAPQIIPKLDPEPSRLKKPFSYWLKKNWYYHSRVKQFYRTMIPADAHVLHIGCKNGYALQLVQPHFGVGIDSDIAALDEAKKRYPEYHFYTDISQLPRGFQFDYILISYTTMEVADVQHFLQQLHSWCSERTRIIIESYSHLWEPVLAITQKLGIRRPTEYKNWLSAHDEATFLYLSGFERVVQGSYLLLPIYIPLISTLCNTVFAYLPVINKLCLNRFLVARPVPRKTKMGATVSVIIACKNEEGNIEAAVKNCPQMGPHTEIIFVEGGSKDGTRQEIERMMAAYPEKNIRFLTQDGKGKGDAVRKGFVAARGDVLMILDADLTVPAEELPKFYDALIAGKGECINGSRLVYGMEDGAMMFSAWLANAGFSWILSWIIGQRVKDTLCGTKVLWRSDYERIARDRACVGLHDPFGDFDLLFGSARLYLKIIDMPVYYKRRQYGTTNISHYKDVWFLVWMCLRAAAKIKIK